MKLLQFSGGLDSLALLFKLRPEWDELHVLWCDTGSAYPETIALMERVKQLIPRFHIARSNKAAWSEFHGYGVAVVPANKTLFAERARGTSGLRYTSYLACCAANIWAPMHEKTKELGATVVYRGQRLDEDYKSPVRSGYVEDGIQFVFPLENWTRVMVREYCERECPEYIPEYYKQGEVSSRDCWDCIGYLEHNKVRINNLPEPQKVIVMQRLQAYNAALQSELIPLKEIFHGI